jgi:histidine phosphotransferase ChpT
VALGVAALPRGGTVNVSISGEPPNIAFAVTAKGTRARLSDEVKTLLTGGSGVEVDAHSIQPYYAGRVANAAGLSVTAEAQDEEVSFRAA